MKKLIIALTLILSPIVATAAPACNAQSVGSTQCMSNRDCECKFFRKSEMAGTPDRFGWDCSLLRPNCSNTADQNVTIQAPYNGPSSVGYGRSTTNITQNPVTSLEQTQSPETTLQQQQQSPTTTNTTTTTQTPTQTSTQTGTQSNNQNSTQNH